MPLGKRPDSSTPCGRGDFLCINAYIR
ncbi:protein of unknown function (plasmid) [Azospirillum baldaniorum]|uniref:Uncharacterized protein n=1 Tax=Azospirillum baldaniorum TaxID=1064539 RepID=A0A9P1NQI7_9PROT|nr:protein of unknown function [Azospirillum baldaniorum]